MQRNLITIWKEAILPNIVSENAVSEPNKTNYAAQSSFQFDIPPRVLFVQDMKTKTPAREYKDLPTLILQPAEQEAYKQALDEFAKKVKKYEELSQELKKTNIRPYNGKQMLLTDVVYDVQANILYLEAVRIDYVLLSSLEKIKQFKAEGSLLQDKVFFKTGVFAPFISKD